MFTPRRIAAIASSLDAGARSRSRRTARRREPQPRSLQRDTRAVPSPLHDALVGLFRDRPELCLTLAVPGAGRGAQVEILRGDLGTAVSVERRADLVAVVRRRHRAKLVLVGEVQLGRDADKRWRWPAYACAARDLFRCEPLLVVVAPDRGIARWCRRPIPIGPRGRLTPLVLGPDEIPRITSVTPDLPAELAVLSALAHGRHDLRVARAAIDVLTALVDEDRQRQYTTVVLDVLGEAMRRRLEADMKLEYYPNPTPLEARILARGVEQGREEGRAAGLAHALLRLLGARGSVPVEIQDRVLACKEPDRLERWLERAVAGASADAVFDAS